MRAKFHFCNSIAYFLASTSAKNQLCGLLVSVVKLKVEMKLGKVG